MKRRALFLVLCLLLAPAELAVGGPSMGSQLDRAPGTTSEEPLPSGSDPAVYSPNTPRLLPVGETPATGFATGTVDMGTALDADSSSLDAQYQSLQIEARLAAAGSDAAARTVVEGALDRLEARVAALRARERTAIQNYHSGVISGRTLLEELTSVHVGATALQTPVQTLDDSGFAPDDSTLGDRRQAVASRLQTLKGPVRKHAATGIQRTGTTDRIHVETTPRGVTLARIDDDTYIRETTRLDALDDSREDDFNGSPSALYEHVGKQYPWVNETFSELRTSQGSIPSVTLFHPQGSLSVLVDGSSQLIVQDVHRLEMATMPTAAGENQTSGDLTVRLNHTYRSGPLLVETVDASGSPTNASVTVDGTTVGTTGTDGRLWTIAPTESQTVRAHTEQTTASVRTA